MTPILQGTVSFTSYQKAERYADEWAGDNGGYAIVVEVFDDDEEPTGELLVMDHTTAEAYLYWHEFSQAIYHADARQAEDTE